MGGGIYLGFAASSTERAFLALELQVWESTSSVEGGLVGGASWLSCVDTGDVKATASSGNDGMLVRNLAQSTQRSRTKSGHCGLICLYTNVYRVVECDVVELGKRWERKRDRIRK